MQILRVFNNNVVLARREDGTEVVLTGRGLGFQTRPGQEVDPLKVVRVFEPTDGRDPDTLGGLVAAIPPEHIALAEEALDLVGVPVTATTLVAIATTSALPSSACTRASSSRCRCGPRSSTSIPASSTVLARCSPTSTAD